MSDQPVQPEPSDVHKMRVMSRRSFIWAGVAVASACGALHIVNGQKESNELNRVFRKGLQANEKVWEALYNRDRLVPTFSPSAVTEERVNGDDGMDDDFDPDDWNLTVEGVHGQAKPMVLTIDEIKAMPATEMTTEFFCIEGWSIIQTWKGVLMREFMKKCPPATMSGRPPDIANQPEDLVPYVGMVTPGKGYYVGLDMPSVIHAQTMLCYEINGKPLSLERGAPLRLVIPVKYGVKNIKRIGLIRYSKVRQGDFWAEQGYDWFAGL
jgi:DMSO/TMAO reductase YedYZ molybdopterin-dependent catalytic subunit